MTTLKDLIVSVKEKNLTKDQLEGYRDQLSSLYAEMMIEMSEIEKEKALYFEGSQQVALNTKGKERSDISIKRQWQSEKKGLREIELKRYCLATKEMLNSLKSRLYSIY